jgi:hypothetical protein
MEDVRDYGVRWNSFVRPLPVARQIVPPMTDSQEQDEQNTWAGCLLLLATVLIAFPAGVFVSMWVAAPLLGLLNANSPDFLKVAVVIVLCSPTVLTGLAFYFGVGALLRTLGIRLTKSRRPRRQRSSESPASELALGSYVLSQQPDRLRVTESPTEGTLSLIMNPLCGTLFGGLFLGLLRDPGGFGKGLVSEVGIIQFDPQGWPLAILGWMIALVAIVFFGVGDCLFRRYGHAVLSGFLPKAALRSEALVFRTIFRFLFVRRKGRPLFEQHSARCAARGSVLLRRLHPGGAAHRRSGGLSRASRGSLCV